ncbi:MAG: amidase family protein, partial [Actinomycetota bacterium]
MADDLHALHATDLLAAYRASDLSPVDAVAACLARIAALDGICNGFCVVSETALDEARASEARWRAGTPLGPLDGVPTSIKDILLTRGWPTLRGSTTVDPAGPWPDDAPAVARLREAGAVLVGKTTTPEFGWTGMTDSPLTGITRNPWDPTRTAGGSSGGAAVAAALGMAALNVGTDGGGSIRMPAGFSGIVGLKPTFGVVPAWPLSVFGTVAHLGPMTRSAADAALMLDVMAAPDHRDWHAVPVRIDAAAGLEGGVRGLRIAYSATLGHAR